MRLLLALMAGLLSGVAGMRRAGEIRRQAAGLRRWQTIMEHMQLLLSQGALPLPEVFRLAATENTPQDRLLQALARAMTDEPLLPLAAHYASMGCMGPEEDILRRMMEGMSAGTAEQRALNVSQAHREIVWLRGLCDDREGRDARMWSTLGWTCGACLTILLL